MLRVKNLFNVFALSAVMFAAGATVATVTLSYLPTVNATPTTVAQGLKQSKAEEIDEEQGLKFKFQDCKRVAKTIICNVLATNIKNENKNAFFNASRSGWISRVIDVSGNQYIANQVNIGQEKTSYYLSVNLIPGIPTKISFSFEIPREITNLAVFEVNYEDNTGRFSNPKVQFRDININGSQASNPANPQNCTCPAQTNPKKPRTR